MSYRVVWFKRDLRLQDHAALAHAARQGPVLCLYIVEPALWAQPDAALQHFEFVRESLTELQHALQTRGGSLQVRTGDAVQVLPDAPSWWHGWSPDGTRLAYVAARGASVIDVYTLPVNGGPETRLTMGEGHCDGPDYAPDGSQIYYNCDRDGHAQIWVMGADGSNQRKLFADDYVNWFPHPSPCGRHVIYLAYPPGTQGHPRDLPISLWRMDPDGSNRQRLIGFNGGQGTMNVPNWAPDGHAFAYVRYAPVDSDTSPAIKTTGQV